MIINDTDQSELDNSTQRTFLLDRTNLQSKSQFTQKQLLHEIIRDKAFYQNPIQEENIKSIIIRFYMKFDMIRPQNRWIVVWNVLVVIVILFYLLEFPLIVGFGQIVWIDLSTELLWVLIPFYIILAVDIFLTPLKMVFREGLLIKDRRILLKQYWKFDFWIDSIGLLSILIPLILKQYYAANLLKILFLPKVIILNKLDDKIVNVLIFETRAKTFYLIARLVVFLILISHYIGIGFYMVGYYVYSTNYYGPNTPNICWLYNAEAYSQIVLLLDWKGQYVYSMYFSLGMTTTIAYGDITPLNPLQTLYIVFALVINCIAFGYILSQILRILIEAFYAEFDMSNIKYAMQNLLMSRNVRPKLRQLIRAHMEQISRQQMYRDRKIERQVISNLPYNLQIALYSKIYKDFMEQLKISPDPFHTDKNTNSRFIEKLLPEIIQARYLVGDQIYKEHQIYTEEFYNHKAYFLKDLNNLSDIILGVGKSPSINLENHTIENQAQYMLFFHDRPIFGEIGFFTGNPRTHWVLSKNNILLYEISRNSFLRNLRYATKKQLQYLSELKQTIQDSYCYICYQKHHFKRCPRTTLTLNLFETVLKNHQNQKMKRRQNAKILNVRTQKRTISAKTNALRIFKQANVLKDKKTLERSKIRMLTHSKHYRRLYYQRDDELSSSECSSSEEEDLDYLIHETKILISNLDKVGNNDNDFQDTSLFDFQFDLFYNFKGYKPRENLQMVLSRLNDFQKILKSKKRLSMKQ